jgi:CRP/FNR family cyclic AMP-dependent transcriptional regulator
MENMDLLKQFYLFKDLAASEMKIILKSVKTESHVAGNEIFSQGESAKALYIIKKGSIKIQQTTEKGDAVEVARLGKDSHFGEMSFLDGEARSATATSLEASEVVRIDYDILSEIIINHPGIAAHFYRQFSIFLCGRLRVTTKDLSFSRSKILSHF